MAIFFSDASYDHSALVFDGRVKILANEEANILMSSISLALTCFFVFLVGFVIYVKITDRFFPR
jgi:hypothetical protein